MPYLKEDVFSGKRIKGKKPIPWGKAGSKVEVVAKHGDVYIVELKNERFSVHKDKLIL